MKQRARRNASQMLLERGVDVGFGALTGGWMSGSFEECAIEPGASWGH